MENHDTKTQVLLGDIAITGMACLYPSAPDLETFWQNIVSGVDAITDVPADRWDPAVFYDPDSASNDRVYCKRGGFLKDLAKFNPLEFGIMPRAVDGGEPGQFLALKLAAEALADAGYKDRRYDPERTEIILGRGNYLDRGLCNTTQHSRSVEQTLQILKTLHPEYSASELGAIRRELKSSLPYFGPENATSIIPNITTGRIANRLDFMGANFTVDAACASSLIATDLATRDLLTHRCDMALAGGIFILPDVPFPIIFCQLGALSRTSRIKPFDANADGTLIGEGAGIIVLKRREDAERDGDRIYALVKGIGVSSDGRALSVAAPRLEGVELALKRAYEVSGVSPQSIELIEAHGTGTVTGDSTEIEALTRVLGNGRGDVPRCALGTIKSMLGHTMPAAGAAGLIKTALALYHKVLPPTLHCETPNPKLTGSPLYVNREARPWIHGSKDKPRRAGVSALGFGGINAHIILEEYPEKEAPRSYMTAWDSEVFVMGGDSRYAMINRAREIVKYLAAGKGVNLKNLAYTLNTTAGETEHRLSIVASSPEDFKNKLELSVQKLCDQNCTRIKDTRGIYFFETPFEKNKKTAFLFPGEGAQYVNMLSDLAMHFPEVRACFDEVDAALSESGNRRGYLPSQVIFPPPGHTDSKPEDKLIWRMDGAVEAVITANKALFTLLTNLGLRPDGVMGHSTGEYSAMHAAQMINIDTGVVRRLNGLYSGLSTADNLPVTMVAAAAEYGQLSEIIREKALNVFLAMDNCPHQVVIVGDDREAARLTEELKNRGIFFETLPFRRAYHTPIFKSACDKIREAYAAWHIRPAAVEIWSCATASPYPRDEAAIHELIVNQWMTPVRFRETVEAMYDSGFRTFIESGPQGNLTGFVDDILRHKEHLAVAANVPRRSGITQLNHLVGVLAAYGVPLDLNYLYRRRAPVKIELEEKNDTEPEEPEGMLTLSLGFPVLRIAPREPVKAALAVHQEEANMGHGATDLQKTESVTGPVPAGTRMPAGSPDGQGVEAPSGHTAVKNREPDFPGTVMDGYFATMAHFLDVQEAVMRTYFARRGNGAGNATQMEKTAGEPEIPVELEMRPERKLARLPVPEQTSVADVPVKVAGETEVKDDTAEPVPVSRIFLNLVSERTGYPVEMLKLDLDMEADLGIDSIKRVEILGAFRERYPATAGEIPSEQIGAFKTLRQVIDYFESPNKPG